MKPRLIRTAEEGIEFLTRRPMKLTLDALGINFIEDTPNVFGEPTYSDWTFAPCLNWVFEYNKLAFVIYTNLDGEYQLDVDRRARPQDVDAFIEWTNEKLNNNE